MRYNENRKDRLYMKKHFAFTMAEILLSLTIIGVVAAITLPSLTGNINERTWNTQRKALYARISQAVSLMPSLNGYGTLTAEQTDSDGNITQSAIDTAAETFVTNGLAKVMKINNICDSDHLLDCGIVTSYTNLAGTTQTWATKLSELNNLFTEKYIDSSNNSSYGNPQTDIDTKAVGFETPNGESVTVYYNPHCMGDTEGNTWHYSQPKMCANFIYDLNGNKGPNTVGKDIGFITALYPTDPTVVAPMPLTSDAGKSSQTAAGELCKTQNPESRLPNRDELTAMFYNRNLIGGLVAECYWSSSVISFGSSGTAWNQYFLHGARGGRLKTGVENVRCVKR